ncbi:MAG TPA: hypothetical protein VF796_25350 [Humisphaera sp.]
MLASLTPNVAPLLAQAAAARPAGRPDFVYRPFLTPLPLWGDHTWPWLVIPLCVAVAVVYKSIKCRHMSQVPKEAAVLTVWILAGMAIAAGALALIVEGMERANT